MKLVSRARSIARWIFRRSAEERRLQAELDSFLDMAAADYERGGLSPEDARRRARMDLGGVEQARERVRTYRHGGGLDAVARDIRLAGRMLLRQPVFSLTIVLTLAMGIGANTAIFTFVDALLLRALPVDRPSELAQLFQTVDGKESESFSYPAVRALDAGVDAFSGVAGFSGFSYEYGRPGALQSVRGAIVTGAFFETLGLRPEVGRLLDARDDERGAPLTAVIGDAFWAREFGRRPDVVGATLTLSGKAVTVVGVAPRGFNGAEVGAVADITIAVAALPRLRPDFEPVLGPGVTFLRVLARTQPGVSRAVAADRLNTAWPQLVDRIGLAGWNDKERRSISETHFRLANGATGWTPARATYRDPLMILMAAVGLLLAIACANVASLLLARAAARQREVAVRLALGAGRWRVARQMLIESLLVSLAGAAAGVPVAWIFDKALVALIAIGPASVLIDISPDWRVLGFAAAVALVSGVAFGLAPALRATAVDPGRGLRDDARTSTSRSRLLPALVTVQVALSLVLVAVAGLFVRSFDNLQRLDAGFRADGALLVSLGTDAVAADAAERLADQVRALPGVRVAGVGTDFPLNGTSWNVAIGPQGQPLPDDQWTRMVGVGPDYFEALGMQLISGRAVTKADGVTAPRIAVLNDAVSERFFPGVNPVGRRLSARLGGAVVELQVVGLVHSARDASLRDAPHPTVYVSYAQLTSEMPSMFPPSLVARVSGPVEPVRAAVAAAIQAAEPRRIVTVRTLPELVRGTIVRDEMLAALAGTFGVMALGLAGLGLYGLLSYTVARRTREIGIRLALGADEGGVVRLVVAYGARLVAIGALLGVPVVWVASRWIESMLFGLTTSDPVSAASTIGALALAAALATFLPARRAARLDPLVVLRRD